MSCFRCGNTIEFEAGLCYDCYLNEVELMDRQYHCPNCNNRQFNIERLVEGVIMLTCTKCGSLIKISERVEVI